MAVRPFFIMPASFSGLIGEWNFVDCVAVVAATFRGGSHYYSDPLQTDLDLRVNFTASLICYLVAGGASMIVRSSFLGCSEHMIKIEAENFVLKEKKRKPCHAQASLDRVEKT